MQLFQQIVLNPIPEHFSERQKLALYALRFSAHAIDLAHARLLNQLQRYEHISHDRTREASILACLLDAWSIVDNAHRFYMVLNGFPGLRGKNVRNEKYCVFRKAEKLRHHYEHMELMTTGSSDAVIFGGLSWIRQESVDAKEFQIKHFSYGLIKHGTIHLFQPSAIFTLPVGDVHLTIGECMINLSEIALALPDIIDGLEKLMPNARPDSRPVAG